MAYYYKTGVIVPFIQKFYKQMIVVVAAIFVASLATMTFSASAAPKTNNVVANAGKVDICHYDEEEDTYHKINISKNAEAKHIENHGDIYAGEYGDDASFAGVGFFYVAECEVAERSAEITSPVDQVYTIGDSIDLLATLVDKDRDDSVAWAVRDNCGTSGTNFAGNVGGFNTPYTWENGETFTSVFDTTGLSAGDYCFIFNPTETFGVDAEIRETQEFSLAFYERSAEISSPLAQAYTVGDQIDLLATLDDKDGDDSVAWAVRSTCTSGTNFAGNVGGFNTPYTWENGETFTSVFDTTGLSAGDYCFIFNPTETTGVDTAIRETQNFVLNADVSGEWLLNVNSGAFNHDMTIVQAPDGSLSGNGGYPSSGPPYVFPYNWTLVGQITRDQVTLTISYENSYEAAISGTFNGVDTMSGGSGTGGVTNWTATRL